MTEKSKIIVAVAEIPDGKMKRLQVAADHYIVILNQGGQYYALDDLCSHEDALLSMGCFKDGYIKCPLHGSRFNLVTGEPMEDPADTPIKTYPVTIEDDKIMVELTG